MPTLELGEKMSTIDSKNYTATIHAENQLNKKMAPQK